MSLSAECLPGPQLSIVVPLFNEEESLPLLVERLLAALRPLGRSFELVLVDDGSSDGTAAVLKQLAAQTPELVAVLLRRNYGQTPAMSAGFDASRVGVCSHDLGAQCSGGGIVSVRRGRHGRRRSVRAWQHRLGRL